MLLRIKNILSKINTINIRKNKFDWKGKVNLNKMSIQINKKVSKINNAEKSFAGDAIKSRKDLHKNANRKNFCISQERSIDVMITRLRQKIELDPKNPKYLQTIRGSGYVLWIE